MQLGAIALQFENLLPPNATVPQAMMHIATLRHDQIVRPVAEAGFSTIELTADLAMFLPQTFAKPAIDSLAALKDELGLRYTVHLPLWSLELSTPLAPVRKGSVHATIDAIRATLPLDPEMYVLHATGPLAAEFYRMNMAEAAKTFMLRSFSANAHSAIREVLAATGLPSRKLAIESIEFPFDLTLELANELDLSFCLDVGHVLAGFSGDISVEDALEQALPRLGEIHLHDCPQCTFDQPGYGQDHHALGTGDLDVAYLFDRLARANFTGPIVFELGLRDALASMQVIRQHAPFALAEAELALA